MGFAFAQPILRKHDHFADEVRPANCYCFSALKYRKHATNPAICVGAHAKITHNGGSHTPTPSEIRETAMPSALTRIAMNRQLGHRRARLRSGTALCAALMLTLAFGAGQPARALTPQQQIAYDVYKELVEINTVTDTGDTARAADAMAARLVGAGFDPADVQVFKPAPRKGNLVARLRGAGARKPMLLLAHLDVVEARRDDWSHDPFKLTEKDGYFYGRGSGDDKFMAAAFVTTLIRYKQDGYKPDRDIILALETDEEIVDRDGLGIQWLLANHRDLIDAEFALNEGGPVGLKRGKPIRNSIQTSEKVTYSYRLAVTNKGGHSSVPSPDNAIYHLAEGLARLGKFTFPVNLNATTRLWFERTADLETPETAADIRSVLSANSDPAALERLSANPTYNAQLRTTCVATLLEGGHAYNALPQSARATVNCRILPGEKVEDVTATLTRVLVDDKIMVTPIGQPVLSPLSVIDEALLSAIEKTSAEFWPGAPVVPVMSTGGTDGMYLRNAGIPTFGHSGLAGDVDDNRAHGKDERVAVKAFYEGGEYLYRLVKRLSGSK
jgi:acetylornithine deacetylase/succinyl-diaminopimelate desuccinylase-like protein